MAKNIDIMKKQFIDAYTEAVRQMTEKEFLMHIWWGEEQSAKLFPKVWSCEICKKTFGECIPLKKDLNIDEGEKFCNKRFHDYCERDLRKGLNIVELRVLEYYETYYEKETKSHEEIVEELISKLKIDKRTYLHALEHLKELGLIK